MLEIKQFPEDMSLLAVDHADMKRCLITGLFEESVEIQGEKRIFYTYIAPGLHNNQSCLVIAPSDDIPVEEFMEQGFWMEFAKENQVFLHFLDPKGQWDDSGVDADYMNKVYVQIQARRYYVTMQDNIYALGFGGGAVIAQQAAMKMTSEWSGLATFGDLSEAAMLNAEVTQKNQAMGRVELSVNASKVQLPVWMFWSAKNAENEAVLQYWKRQNDASEEVYSNKDAHEIYFPSVINKKSSITEEKIAQVRVNGDYEGKLNQEAFEAVWGFLRMARRHRSFGTKALRSYKNPIEYGAELHTMEVDGYTRLWYEYVPEKVKKEGRPVPVVVNMHGRGGSAESFMDLSVMNQVAEERGFILLLPEASVHCQKRGGVGNVLYWSLATDGEKTVDVEFVLRMIEDVKARYAVDESRIYACGQSSGGMMSSELALRAPEVFAAVAPWSAIKNPDFDVAPPESITPAVPYFFLFGDSDWLCVDKENGQLEYKAAGDIAEFLRNLMKIYELDEEPSRYESGEISFYVYTNKKHTPMLTVGVVKNMSHANYPRESWITYDEFLAKFSKKADGTLLYMGKEAI